MACGVGGLFVRLRYVSNAALNAGKKPPSSGCFKDVHCAFPPLHAIQRSLRVRGGRNVRVIVAIVITPGIWGIARKGQHCPAAAAVSVT